MGRFIVILTVWATLLATSPVNADVFGNSDDRYAGLQFTVPLDIGQGSLISEKVEFSAMLIEQRDGLKEGFVFTRAFDGSQTLGFLSPTSNFRIGQSRASLHTIPFARFNDSTYSNDFNNGTQTFITIAIGAAVIIKLIDYASDQIVDCITDEDEDNNYCDSDED